MLVIDENLPATQRQLLRKWRVRFRAVGADVAASGIQDENLILVLHKLAQPVFFTLDRHFFRKNWIHASYGLVWMDVPDNDAAQFIMRFLRHAAFDTQAKRLGVVARVRAADICFWRKGASRLQHLTWSG